MELQIIAYGPDAQSQTFNDVEERAGRLEMMLTEARAQPALGKPKFSRIETVDICALWSERGGWYDSARSYKRPAPSAALTYELRLYLRDDKWADRFIYTTDEQVNIICESHAERRSLAAYLSENPRILFDGHGYKVASMSLLDRMLVFDNSWAFRRSRLGSQSKLDQRATRQVMGLRGRKDFVADGCSTILPLSDEELRWWLRHALEKQSNSDLSKLKVAMDGLPWIFLLDSLCQIMREARHPGVMVRLPEDGVLILRWQASAIKIKYRLEADKFQWIDGFHCLDIIPAD